MPKTTKHGGASDKTRWKEQGEDGSAREGASAAVDTPEVEEVGERPNVNALKADWVDYAVEVHGADRDEAEATLKDDLIATYG